MYLSFDFYRSMIRFDEEKGEQQYSSLIEDFSGVKVNVSKIGSAGCISINASLEAICFLKVIIINQ